MTGARGRRPGRVVIVTCAAALVLALVGGCGDERAPGEAVPALADRLERVDLSIETGDYADARAQLDRLVAETARADVAGEISNEQADRILEAVEAVLAGLPPPAEPAPEPEPPADGGDPDELEEEDKEEEKDEEKDDKKDKDGKKGQD